MVVYTSVMCTAILMNATDKVGPQNILVAIYQIFSLFLTWKLLLWAYKVIWFISLAFIGHERLITIKVEAGGSKGNGEMKG